MAASNVVVALRLYIAGSGSNSLTALRNIKAICEQHYPGAHELEVVDMLAEPMRALADGIIVSPTLLRISPLPVRRLMGNLADPTQVIMILEGG